MLIDAENAALEDREKAFNGIGIMTLILIPHIFVFAVIDGAC